jgi:hypothetical protein
MVASFPSRPPKVVVQGLQVRLIPQLEEEGFERLSGIVLASVEATIYERLYATPQGG